VCARLAYLTVCCLLGRAIWFSVETSRFFEQITPERSAIDLLDPAPLYRFGRMGLRLSFTWVVGLTLFSLLTLFGTRATVTAAAPVLLAIAVTAGMALVVPVRTLRRRIRISKASERAWLDRELRRLHDEAARGEHPADGRIADLCALRERVEAVREWPFGSLMLLEFVLHLMIPLAPFFGGALVHYLISRAFE
jgi:hypothetical protein